MKLSRPVVYLAVLAAIVAFFVMSSDASGPPPAAHPKKIAKKSEAGWDFPAPDPALHFAKPRIGTRNVFAPLVRTERLVKTREVKDDQVQIPSKLADGEANWAYTGMAEVDGIRMALLENSTKHQSGYVREGEPWKKSRIVGISSACIVMADEKGVTETVFRFNPNDPPKIKPVPDGGFQPTGAIGNNLRVRPLTLSPGQIAGIRQ